MATMKMPAVGGISGLSETVLFDNSSNPTTAYPSSGTYKDETLSDSVENYKYVKFKYRMSTSDATTYESIMSVTDYKKTLSSLTSRATWFPGGVPSGQSYGWGRFLMYVDNTTIRIYLAYAINTASSSTSNIIPLQLIGMK